MTTRLPGFLATSRTCAPSQPQKTDPEDAAPTAAGPGDPAGLATEAANQAGPLSGESTPPARAIFRAAPPQLLDKAATPVPKAPPPGITPPVMFRSTAARRAKVEEAPAEPAPAKAPPKPASTRPRRAPRAATTIPAPPARPFRVVPLTRMAQGDRWRTEAMRSYSVALLLWFVRGQGRITIAGSTYGFGPHNVVFLPPGTMHGFELSGQVNGHAVFFPDSGEGELPDVPLHLRPREPAAHTEISQLIDNLQREIERAGPGEQRALAHHAGLLGVWLERQAAGQPERVLADTAARRLAAAFTALVEENYSAALTIADHAARLGVTPAHLTRSCKIACGRSAHDILSDRIFYEARRRLRETREPVGRIAHALGFTTAAYFTRAFQKATGTTPSAFRRAR